MKVFYSEEHRKHEPPFEVFDGGLRTPYLENTDRMDRILKALQQVDWAEICEPGEFGLEPIQAVHDRDYIDFLASCWAEWQASEAADKSVLLPATFALRRQPQKPTGLLGRAGYYLMDLSACIVEGTYPAALGLRKLCLECCRSCRKRTSARHLACAARPATMPERITRADTASSITRPSLQTGFPRREGLPCWISTTTAATARRIFFTIAAMY